MKFNLRISLYAWRRRSAWAGRLGYRSKTALAPARTAL